MSDSKESALVTPARSFFHLKSGSIAVLHLKKNLVDAVIAREKGLLELAPVQLYHWGGTCDETIKNEVTKKLTRYASANECVEVELQRLIDYISHMNADIKLKFIEIPHISTKTYNESNLSADLAVDKGITNIVNSVNLRKLTSPFLTAVEKTLEHNLWNMQIMFQYMEYDVTCIN